MVIKAVQDWWAQLFYTHSHSLHQFNSLVEWEWWKRPPFPPFRRHEIFNAFALCMCMCLCNGVCEYDTVCVWFDACVLVFLFDFTCACVLPRDGGEHYMRVYIILCVCVCACMCVRVCAHAWLSGLSQTAQNSLQSDISPAGDKWWLDERERWGLARISVSLRWRHIYTHTHLYTHTHTHTHTHTAHTERTHAHTHTLIHWQNTADTQNYQTRGWTLRDGQANLLIVQSCTCVLVSVSVHVCAHFLPRYTEIKPIQ